MTPPEFERFRHRRHAGQLLASRLLSYSDREDVMVLALPRGGVPVGYEIAAALHVPLDVCLVRKLGVPEQPELAMGAIARDNICLLNHALIQQRQISKTAIATVIRREWAELERRTRAYCGEDEQLPVTEHHTIILVDDGIATGSTFQAAIAAVNHHHPNQLVAAVPVAPPGVYRQIQPLVSQLECLTTPENLMAIGYWYDDFAQVSDEEVRLLLQTARRPDPDSPGP